MNIYNIKGKVYEEGGTVAVGRTVNVYDRATSQLVRTTTTDSNGDFYVRVSNTNIYYVVVLPNLSDGSNAKIFDNITPQFESTITDVNNIGIPGNAGFGQGICPVTPSDFEPLIGFDDPNSENYGNYKFSFDSSIMIWIPAFYYKWGTGSNGLSLNDCSVVPYATYVDEAAANADGFALHRAFIDGGVIKDGFFVDRYPCSANGTVASSLPYAYAMGSSSPDFSNLGETNTLEGCHGVSKTRGTDFFTMSIFQAKALSILTYAHGRASSSTLNCGWWGLTNNYPRVFVSAFSAKDDSTMRYYISLQSTSFPMTHGAFDIKKVTHNGQLCGVEDLQGNKYQITPGLTVLSNDFKYLKESFRMKDLVKGTTGNGALNAANYDSLGATLSDYGTTSNPIYPINSVQTFYENTNRASTEYRLTQIGITMPTAWSTTDPKYYGGCIYRGRVANLYPLIGSYNSENQYGGPWSLYLLNYSTYGNGNFGLRSALYL